MKNRLLIQCHIGQGILKLNVESKEAAMVEYLTPAW